MSVYTLLTCKDVEEFLVGYGIGQLENLTGVKGGVENTNYFLDIVRKDFRSRYVLTLFEYLSPRVLPFFIDVTDHLESIGLPVPSSIRDQRGVALHTLKNKPALMVKYFKGEHPNPNNLTSDICSQVGEVLARIHCAGDNLGVRQENQRGLPWLDEQQRRLYLLLDPIDSGYMKKQWIEISTALDQFKKLPYGLIHGDLFHDNILIYQGRLSAIIDFYQSCYDWLIYDIAVTVNDLCISDDLLVDTARYQALVNAYAKIRPFTADEREAWPWVLRLAAFRFWISRIITFVHPESPADDEHHHHIVREFLDPNKFRDMLRVRTEIESPPLPG